MFASSFCSQDSRPTLINAIEDCVYTFLWLTAAACPLNITQHDNCMVNNPATGPAFETRSRVRRRRRWVLLFNDLSCLFPQGICLISTP